MEQPFSVRPIHFDEIIRRVLGKVIEDLTGDDLAEVFRFERLAVVDSFGIEDFIHGLNGSSTNKFSFWFLMAKFDYFIARKS